MKVTFKITLNNMAKAILSLSKIYVANAIGKIEFKRYISELRLVLHLVPLL